MDGANLVGALAFLALAAVAPMLPAWLVIAVTIASPMALVVWAGDPVGTGLVPFGSAVLCHRRYAVALIGVTPAGAMSFS